MCNLYRLRVSRAEYNAYFQANDEFRREIEREELEKDYVAPGKPGIVVREVEGKRQIETMKWGFCTRKPRKRPAREGELPFLYDWWTNAKTFSH